VNTPVTLQFRKIREPSCLVGQTPIWLVNLFMSATPDYIAWKYEMWSELAKMCIAVEAFCWFMSEEGKEEHENLIQNFHSPGLLNLGPPEQEAGMLTIHLWRLLEALSPWVLISSTDNWWVWPLLSAKLIQDLITGVTNNLIGRTVRSPPALWGLRGPYLRHRNMRT